MASIGRVALSVASGVMETTVALANFNFDFSIIRMDPPAEYREVGSHLTKRRRKEAEEGSIHATARRLGALFADVVPQVPNLQKIYGQRASEIVMNPSVNPEASATYGALQGYVGLDATSVWAAATSGRGAIQVHLLACILARQWPASQAIAIWSEMVTSRRKQLEILLQDDQFHLGQLMAAQIDVGPRKLADWDASARSWLHAADKVFAVQQKQLMLIIDNIDRSLDSKDNVYETVHKIWCSALDFMEKVASGMALSADAPELFLGLSAWHLYPDMTVLGNDPKQVYQKDTLIPTSAVITIGMQTSKVKKLFGGEGIVWTVPLSRLKYYGRPQISSSQMGTGSIRASFRRMIQIGLGSLMSNWVGLSLELEDVLQFVIALDERCFLESSLHDPRPVTHPGWPRLLAHEAELYFKSQAKEQQEFSRYVNLGRRRYRKFLEGAETFGSLFGTANITDYLRRLPVEEQIQSIRDLAANCSLGLDLRESIILYTDFRRAYTGVASVYPQRFLASDGAEFSTHRRWALLYGNAPVDMPERFLQDSPWSAPINDRIVTWATCTTAAQSSLEVMIDSAEPFGFLTPGTLRDPTANRIIERHWSTAMPRNTAPNCIEWLPSTEEIDLDVLDKQMNLRLGVTLTDSQRAGWRLGSSRPSYDTKSFKLVFETPFAALYVPLERWKPTRITASINFVTDSLKKLRDSEIIITRHLYDVLSPKVSKSFALLQKASQIYSMLPTADVDITIAAKPLHTAEWLLSNTEHLMTTHEAFACVALFDSGVNLRAADFRGVIALSSRDVMYVCDALLEFPPKISNGIRLVPGNIGKPGISFLVCPQDLDPPEALDGWELINHSPFDGKLEDSFNKTSLHLQLTGGETPLNVGSVGQRFVDAMFVESVIKVFERNECYADIDIMSLYKPQDKYGTLWLDRRLTPSECSHEQAERTNFSDFGLVTTIDNWPEMMEPPMNACVVRAHGNWSARLALASFIKTTQEGLVVSQGQLCWSCVGLVAKRLGINYTDLVVLV